MSQRVFVCYARVDQSFALPLAEQLKARGVPVWIDQSENIPAEDWDREIDRALRECSHLLIVLSPASVESREVRGELRTALDLGKPVLPVLYQACDIPRQLRIVQFVDFIGKSPSDPSALTQLLRGLQPGARPEPVVPLGPPAPVPGAVRPSWRPARLVAMSVRTKAVLAAVLAVVLLSATWFGLDMATEARRRLNDAALSPDGAFLATATGQGLGVRGAVRVWDVSTGREAAFLPIEGPVWVCGWSPDGRKLAVGDHAGTIRIYDRGSWQQTAALTGSTSMIQVLAWSADSGAIATGDSSGSLWVWDVPSGALRFSKPVQSDRIDAVAWSHDGSLLASAGADRAVALVKAQDGEVSKRLEGHASSVTTVAFSPDDARLASGSLEAPYVIVWNVSGTGTELQGHRGQVERVAWSPDGRFLASAGKDNAVHLWSATLALVRRVGLAGQFNSGTSLAWSPDGTRLAVGDSTGIRLLNPEVDAPAQTLTERSTGTFDSIEIAGWSRDGKRLGTFNTSDRMSGVWDVERATRLQTFRVGLWRSITE